MQGLPTSAPLVYGPEMASAMAAAASVCGTSREGGLTDAERQKMLDMQSMWLRLQMGMYTGMPGPVPFGKMPEMAMPGTGAAGIVSGIPVGSPPRVSQ